MFFFPLFLKKQEFLFLIFYIDTNAFCYTPNQLCFFKKAVKSLETVEPHVKSVTEQQHIDYHFTGLEEDDGDDGDEDDNGYDENDDGELSFDYGQIEERDVSTSQNSMEVTTLVDQEFVIFFSTFRVS